MRGRQVYARPRPGLFRSGYACRSPPGIATSLNELGQAPQVGRPSSEPTKGVFPAGTVSTETAVGEGCLDIEPLDLTQVSVQDPPSWDCSEFFAMVGSASSPFGVSSAITTTWTVLALNRLPLASPLTAPRRLFFAALAALLLLFVFWGFARTLYLRAFFDVPELPPHLYLHGAVLTAWFLLLMTQAVLIQTRRVRIHRGLGVAGAILAVGVVATGAWTLALRESEAPDLPNMMLLIAFALCIGSAIGLRRRPAAHKRLMLIGSITITAPAIDRAMRPFLGSNPALAVLILTLVAVVGMFAAIVIYDGRRPRLATIGGVLSLFVAAPVIGLLLIRSGVWDAFVAWVH